MGCVGVWVCGGVRQTTHHSSDILSQFLIFLCSLSHNRLDTIESVARLHPNVSPLVCFPSCNDLNWHQSGILNCKSPVNTYEIILIALEILITLRPHVPNQIGCDKIRELRIIYRFLRDKISYHEIMKSLKAINNDARSLEIWQAFRWPCRCTSVEIYGNMIEKIWGHFNFLKWIPEIFIDDKSVLATNNRKKFIFHIVRVLWFFLYENYIHCFSQAVVTSFHVWLEEVCRCAMW